MVMVFARSEMVGRAGESKLVLYRSWGAGLRALRFRFDFLRRTKSGEIKLLVL